jgi:hypothetical protein
MSKRFNQWVAELADVISGKPVESTTRTEELLEAMIAQGVKEEVARALEEDYDLPDANDIPTSTDFNEWCDEWARDRDMVEASDLDDRLEEVADKEMVDNLETAIEAATDALEATDDEIKELRKATAVLRRGFLGRLKWLLLGR